MFPCLYRPFAPPPVRLKPNEKLAAGPSPWPTLKNTKNQLYKTELCQYWEEQGECRRGDQCWFAHGYDELRPIQRRPEYKTKECAAFVQSGTCKFGKRCTYIHPRYDDQSVNFGGRDTSKKTTLLSRVGICQAEPPTKCSFSSDAVSFSSMPAKAAWTAPSSFTNAMNSAVPATPPFALPTVMMTKQPQAHPPMRAGMDSSSSSLSTGHSQASTTTEQRHQASSMHHGSFDLSMKPSQLFPDIPAVDQDLLYNLLVSDAVARSHKPSSGSEYADKHDRRRVAVAPQPPVGARSTYQYASTSSYANHATGDAPQGYFFKQ